MKILSSVNLSGWGYSLEKEIPLAKPKGAKKDGKRFFLIDLKSGLVGRSFMWQFWNLGQVERDGLLPLLIYSWQAI